MTAAKADRFTVSSKACQEAKPPSLSKHIKTMMIAGGSDGISNNLGEVYNILHLPLFGQFLERVRLQKSKQKISTNVLHV